MYRIRKTQIIFNWHSLGLPFTGATAVLFLPFISTKASALDIWFRIIFCTTVGMSPNEFDLIMH